MKKRVHFTRNSFQTLPFFLLLIALSGSTFANPPPLTDPLNSQASQAPHGPTDLQDPQEIPDSVEPTGAPFITSLSCRIVQKTTLVTARNFGGSSASCGKNETLTGGGYSILQPGNPSPGCTATNYLTNQPDIRVVQTGPDNPANPTTWDVKIANASKTDLCILSYGSCCRLKTTNASID